MKDSGDGGRIKVVDRRRIDDSGDEKGPESGKEGAAAVGEASRGDRARASAAAGEGQARGEPAAGEAQQVDFVTFILSFSQTAFLSLGLGPHPETGQAVQVDLNAARWTIDALEMLQQKTRGNLSGEEERIFEMLLAELRMAFVQVASGAVRRGT